ncbi:hypothetical protein DRQ25_07160 [Candidatus Fermentibacteria bacterium]|nr:MAG: hypothetical protein DRQ25_07160 [Candidatus Fermentibacteria bacterium]
MRSVWHWGQADEKKRGRMHPILLMAAWLKDAERSRAEGRPIFKLPYPGGSWYTEKTNNQHLLELMDLAWRTAVLSIKNWKGEKLTKEEDTLLSQIAEVME